MPPVAPPAKRRVGFSWGPQERDAATAVATTVLPLVATGGCFRTRVVGGGGEEEGEGVTTEAGGVIAEWSLDLGAGIYQRSSKTASGPKDPPSRGKVKKYRVDDGQMSALSRDENSRYTSTLSRLPIEAHVARGAAASRWIPTPKRRSTRHRARLSVASHQRRDRHDTLSRQSHIRRLPRRLNAPHRCTQSLALLVAWLRLVAPTHPPPLPPTRLQTSQAHALPALCFPPPLPHRRPIHKRTAPPSAALPAPCPLGRDTGAPIRGGTDTLTVLPRAVPLRVRPPRPSARVAPVCNDGPFGWEPRVARLLVPLASAIASTPHTRPSEPRGRTGQPSSPEISHLPRRTPHAAVRNGHTTGSCHSKCPTSPEPT